MTILGAGCAGSEPSARGTPTDGPTADAHMQDHLLYFSSPQQAVETATPLIKAKDWPTLSRYYDLSQSNVEREQLVNGTFFYRDQLTGAHHPANFAHYKHPFAPGFKLLRVETVPGDESLAKVIMLVEIDQGDGMIQRGMSAFLMRKHPQGWQILPTSVDP